MFSEKKHHRDKRDETINKKVKFNIIFFIVRTHKQKKINLVKDKQKYCLKRYVYLSAPGIEPVHP